MIILWALLAGFTYRLRGGLLKQYTKHDWIGRSCWAFIIAALVYYRIGNWQIAPLIFILTHLGSMMGYFNGEFDLSLPKNHNPLNYVRLTARGMFIIFPLALIFSTISLMGFLWYGVAIGTLFVPCYLAGNVIYKYCKWQSWTQWGEWLLGMVIGSALCL